VLLVPVVLQVDLLGWRTTHRHPLHPWLYLMHQQQ
jgi:hypothetical protein